MQIGMAVLVVFLAVGGPTTPRDAASAPRLPGLLVAASPVRTSDIVHQLPDSIRMNLLAALARGDIAGAISLYQLAYGTRVARAVYEGFRNLKGNPAYLKVTSTGSGPGANLIGFELRTGDPRSTVQLSNNFTHYAVQVGERIYDAFTGPAGLRMAEYLGRLKTHDAARIAVEVVSELP